MEYWTLQEIIGAVIIYLLGFLTAAIVLGIKRPQTQHEAHNEPMTIEQARNYIDDLLDGNSQFTNRIG